MSTRAERQKIVGEAKLGLPKLQEKFEKNPDVIFQVLNGLEKSIYHIMEWSEDPMTTKEIRNAYIEDLIKSLDNKKITEEGNKKKTKTERVDFYEGELKKMGKKIPSFKTFDKVLLVLESMGIMAIRSDSTKKGKGLWFINPHFTIALKEQEKDKTKEIEDRMFRSMGK